MAAEITAGFLGPALQVVKWVGAPILRQFKYLCCFTTNITNLENEAKKLQDAERDLQGRVDAARNDVQLIASEVETWLQNSKEIINEEEVITKEVPKVKGGCLKLRARFSLSKRAVKTADRLKELRGQCKFDVIFLPRPPAAMEAFPLERTCEFKSRKQIEKDIMSALRGEDVIMMGICGMGGLGKTTTAKRIMNRALEEHVFDEVVMAVVSQEIEKLKIQLEIGGSLGLNLKDETSQAARAKNLLKRLSGTKRTLLVLDDVWEKLALEDLGIPRGYKGCTILLTSRNREVLTRMDVQKIFDMKVLSAEDSWIMFRDRVGACVDNTELSSIAKEVVNECKGLPLALTTVGASQIGEMNVDIWKNTLQQLRRSDPDIPEYIAQVYNPLRLSYNVLGPKYQYVFLLCCLYPEDAHIPLEQLTYFCMGLRLLEGASGNVEEARNRICALTKVLKNRSLLLDSEEGDGYVRMHDVVRDVCIYIAKQEGYIGDNDCSWLSSSHRSELPMGLAVSKLRLLFFRAQQYLEGFTLENSFLEGFRDLSVICIERYSLVSLSHTTQMLRNLNTLVLDQCQRVETLSVVGKLVNLEILICRHCYSIVELPPEIKGLNRLKVLELTGCENLQRIGRDIISSLVGLEELKMLASFKKWEGEDREERENAGLRELGQLPNLRCLEIEIEDPALATENIRLSSKIDRFIIKFCHLSSYFHKTKYGGISRRMGLDLEWEDATSFKKQMRLKWEGATCLGDWIKMLLLRDPEYLLLVGNGANNVDLTKLKIKYLVLGACESMMNVVTISMDDAGGATAFPSLEVLKLFELPKLEEVWNHRVSLNCFQILKTLILNDLPALKQLWKSSQNDVGKDFLPQLEVLQIRSCVMMEAVFLWEGDSGNENNSCYPITKSFPKLKELDLHEMPNLISFCQGIEGIEFPLLKRMEIEECWEMKGMVWNENNWGGSSSSSNASIHALFCPQQDVVTSRDGGGGAIVFPSIEHLILGQLPKLEEICDRPVLLNCFQILKELELSYLPALKQLWKSSQNDLGKDFLPQLEVLQIKYCGMMETVFLWKGEDGNENTSCHHITKRFPKLKELWLVNLPNLISLCQGIEGIEFPLLKRIWILECKKMKGMVANGVTSNDNNSGGSSSNAADTIHLFCESQQVSFGCLKELKTDRNPFCSHTIHVPLFNGLEELEIIECRGSRSLFTSSMAENLVNLKELKINNCDEMVEVIKDDEGRGMRGGERALLFPKLDYLCLKNLPKLVSFCKWKCDVELPSLSGVEIVYCDNMESCTMGPLITPKLKSVKTDEGEFGGVKDLNEWLYLRRVEEWETSEVATQMEAAREWLEYKHFYFPKNHIFFPYLLGCVSFFIVTLMCALLYSM